MSLITGDAYNWGGGGVGRLCYGMHNLVFE